MRVIKLQSHPKIPSEKQLINCSIKAKTSTPQVLPRICVLCVFSCAANAKSLIWWFTSIVEIVCETRFANTHPTTYEINEKLFITIQCITAITCQYHQHQKLYQIVMNRFCCTSYNRYCNVALATIAFILVCLIGEC